MLPGCRMAAWLLPAIFLRMVTHRTRQPPTPVCTLLLLRATQLTASDNDNEESFPTWSPDGKYIAVWSYKTFELSFYTAIAIVPSESAQPIVLKNDADIWPRDQQGYRLSGGRGNISWR